MIRQINKVNDVRTFARQLVAEGLNFHPDDDFSDYINYKTKQPFYTEKEIERRNQLMNQSFEVCEKNDTDIYGIMLEEFVKETKKLNLFSDH